MTLERRNDLIDAVIAERPSGRGVIFEKQTLTGGNWDLVAHSYQQAFDVLWDHATAQGKGNSLIVGPLMMIWRQSVELTIKAAIQETTRAEPPGTHELVRLFDALLKARRDVGALEDDDTPYTAKVRAAVVEFQNFDQQADRYRYPTGKHGEVYPGFAVHLDRLHQAHWLITNWCDAASVEAEQYNLYGRGGEGGGR